MWYNRLVIALPILILILIIFVDFAMRRLEIGSYVSLQKWWPDFAMRRLENLMILYVSLREIMNVSNNIIYHKPPSDKVIIDNAVNLFQIV